MNDEERMNEEEDVRRVITIIPPHPAEEARRSDRRRALLGTGVVLLFAMLAFVVFDWMSGEDTGSETVPPQFIGVYTSSHREYGDRYLELKPTTITFSTGGTNSVVHSIIGVAGEDDDDMNFVIHFKGVDGTKYRREIITEDAGHSFFFRTQPGVVWTQFELESDNANGLSLGTNGQ